MDLQTAKLRFGVKMVSQEEKSGVGLDEAWENAHPLSHRSWEGACESNNGRCY
jgi:hypothetical protein